MMEVEAILKRDRLTLPEDEFQRLVAIYAELQEQLTALRAPEFRNVEPAVIYPAD